MLCTVTAKAKLPATTEVVMTVTAFRKGLQYCVDAAWKRGIKNKVKLQPFVYAHLRKTLPAQLSIACITQACAMVKKAVTKPDVERASVGYNFPRSARYADGVLHLRLLHERRDFPITIPACYTQYLSWEMREGLLTIDRRGRAYFLFRFQHDAPAPTGDGHVVGIDLGIKNLAVTSDGDVFRAPRTRIMQYRHTRRELQAKGTRAARRRLARRRSREQRFMAWKNHNISKQIVNKADTIVFEDLTHIRPLGRGRTQNARRRNRWLHGWAFRQLQSFTTYKAVKAGKQAVFKNPTYTSQTCSRCGLLGSRYGDSFVCLHCGFSSDADFNASCMLRRLHVTQPHSSCDDASLHSGTVC